MAFPYRKFPHLLVRHGSNLHRVFLQSATGVSALNTVDEKKDRKKERKKEREKERMKEIKKGTKVDEKERSKEGMKE